MCKNIFHVTGFDDKLTNNGFSSLTETEFIETLKTRKKKEITECLKSWRRRANPMKISFIN